MKPSAIPIFVLCLLSFAGLLFAETGAPPAVSTDLHDEKNTTMSFRNADLRDVLRIIAEEYHLNIVMSDEVAGTVTLRLKEASLHSALDSLLISRGLDYEIRDNIIRVAPAEVITSERNQRQAKLDLEALVSEVIVLHYLDANDVKDMIKSMLTSRGSATVLERRAYKGFQFGGQGTGQRAVAGSTSSGGGSASPGISAGVRERRTGNEESRSNTLMVVDVQRQVEKIKEVIKQVDIAPRQVLIDAKILEVDMNSLEDLGIDLNSAYSIPVKGDKTNDLVTDINSGSSSGSINSNVFSNIFPTSSDSGIHAVFTKLNGEDVTATLHALLQNKHTKTLSAPHILTIENQEAAILVGEQFPIFQANVTDQGTTTETLSFYQPVGVILQVIVQVTPNNDINMIIHPTVSSVGTFVTGTSGLTQPRINIREADTRVLVKNNETLVIGGLLQDTEDERYFRIPFLDRLPLLGNLFTRKQTSITQRNLLIFITPKIVEKGRFPLTESEQGVFQSINDPDHYGFLQDRRKIVRATFAAAKKNYQSKNYVIARAQFEKVLGLNPSHAGALKYLKKLSRLSVSETSGAFSENGFQRFSAAK